LNVTAAHPVLTTVTNWNEYPGRLEAMQMVEIRPRVSGYLDSIHFKDGAEVKDGDLLFTIDPKPYQATLNAASALRESAATHLEWTSNDLARAENLLKSRAISAEEYDSRNKAMREAQAALGAAAATEEVARLNLDFTAIKSPISGKVSQRMMTIGNLVQGGSSASMLTTVVSVDPIYCYFSADEAAYLAYKKNNGNIEPDAGVVCELGLADETGFPHKGRLDFVDNQVNPNSGTIQARGVFANEDRALLPGFFARVRVPAGPPVQALLVPDVAVSSDQGHKFVYVVNKDSMTEIRLIQVDHQLGGFWQVTDGLSTNDNVIVNGLLMVRPGIPVKVVDPNAAPAQAPAQAAAH
jgi:RND family efflux transporter MFP subunit